MSSQFELSFSFHTYSITIPRYFLCLSCPSRKYQASQRTFYNLYTFSSHLFLLTISIHLHYTITLYTHKHRQISPLLSRLITKSRCVHCTLVSVVLSCVTLLERMEPVKSPPSQLLHLTCLSCSWLIPGTVPGKECAASGKQGHVQSLKAHQVN